jgi:hypothetical protein
MEAISRFRIIPLRYNGKYFRRFLEVEEKQFLGK